jgi:hypothetical protein
VDNTVPYMYRMDYLDMLMEHTGSFSGDSHDLGFSDLLEHDIELKDRDPVYIPQFWLPREQLDLIKSNVAGWIRAGIVEKTKSKYNAPLFCVPKKGHGMRCVLDYRYNTMESALSLDRSLWIASAQAGEQRKGRPAICFKKEGTQKAPIK